MILLEGSGLDQFRLLDEDTAPSYCIKALEQQSNDKGTMRYTCPKFEILQTNVQEVPMDAFKSQEDQVFSSRSLQAKLEGQFDCLLLMVYLGMSRACAECIKLQL